jgi:Acetyltransferase (GNAT) family
MNIGVRNATDQDMCFVHQLAMDSALHGVPYGRSITNLTVQERVRESIQRIQSDDDTVILIAYDSESESQEPMGYLILDLCHTEGSTGEKQSLIFDLAVHPNHRGTPAVGQLVREAARRTAKAGLDYMIGEVSAHNDRAYLQALRLGFELERFQIVMACSETGPKKMPGRPEEERHYAQSRGKKIGRYWVPGTWEQAAKRKRFR